MRREGLTPSIAIDCSHANSMRLPANQPKILMNIVDQINNGEKSICGVMLESYIKSGRQDISEEKGKMIPGLSVTDPCLPWQDTEKAIMDAYNALK